MKDTNRYAYSLSCYVLKQMQVHSAELGVDLRMKSSDRSYHIVIQVDDSNSMESSTKKMFGQLKIYCLKK